jgi:uncharacterized protein
MEDGKYIRAIMKYLQLVRVHSSLNTYLFFYAFFLIGIFGSSIRICNASLPSAQPSFSCLFASKIEAVICTNPDLAAKDRTMSVLFAASRISAFGFGPSGATSLQGKWLKSRDSECLKEKNQHDCLSNLYDQRLKKLAVATLFQTHDISIAELTRQDSKTSQIYEAIYRYATLDNPADRIKVVTPLITSAFDSFHDKELSLLEDNVKSADDIINDDESFSAFLDTASVSNYDLTLPCVSIIRRPDLVDALGAKYGGALDSHLINSDCWSTLPTVPAFQQLMAKADSLQPPCHSTIRFSQKREYDKILNAVALHRMDLLDDDDDDDIDELDPLFQKEYQTEIGQASKELSQYYVYYFHMPPSVAKEDAESAVDAAIHSAFNICF